MLLGRTSTRKSTVAALIVGGIKCVIDNSIEFALGYSKMYRLQTESTITAVIGTLAYGSNVL